MSDNSLKPEFAFARQSIETTVHVVLTTHKKSSSAFMILLIIIHLHSKRTFRDLHMFMYFTEQYVQIFWWAHQDGPTFFCISSSIDIIMNKYSLFISKHVWLEYCWAMLCWYILAVYLHTLVYKEILNTAGTIHKLTGDRLLTTIFTVVNSVTIFSKEREWNGVCSIKNCIPPGIGWPSNVMIFSIYHLLIYI